VAAVLASRMAPGSDSKPLSYYLSKIRQGQDAAWDKARPICSENTYLSRLVKALRHGRSAPPDRQGLYTHCTMLLLPLAQCCRTSCWT
jgi:hypothetical protein